MEFQRLSIVSRETMGRLERYLDLLKRWRKAINLVAESSLEDPWRRHFLDSAQLMEFVPKGAPRIVDLGSGAGFPGLVLAILGAGEIHLVEADGRKCAFLREAARLTDTRVEIHLGRIEAIEPIGADLAVARALAPLDKLLEYAARHVKPDGSCLLLKGRSADEELTLARKEWSMSVRKSVNHADSSGWILHIGDLVRVTHHK
jgi:16S rRNA (guanine527-N7)-methyltransferase